MNENSDIILIKIYLKSRDETILGDLFKKYIHLIYGVCLKYLKNTLDAEDASMQIFEEMMKKIDRYEITNFSGWLYSVAKNHCLMHLRKNKHQQIISIDIMENEVHAHPVEEPAIDDTNLHRCIDELVEAQRRCVYLFYMQSMCYQQIVQSTGYELKKVKSYIQNGKRNLKTCLEKHHE